MGNLGVISFGFAAGVVMFGESLSLMRVTAAGFIVVGLIMMKASA